MADRVTFERIEAYWADMLGCDPRVLHEPGVVLIANASELADYPGAYLLRWSSTCIISVPEPRIEAISAAMVGCTPDAVFEAGTLATLFAGEVERAIGPAVQACTGVHSFQPVDERATRPLTQSDGEALRRLATACDPTEWEHSGIEGEGAVPFGCFVGEQLAAAGMLRARGILRHVGVVTHPAVRGQGYGRAVVSAMTAEALREGAIPHYQTLAANTASRAIAQSLGFTEYARTLAVRMREPKRVDS